MLTAPTDVFAQLNDAFTERTGLEIQQGYLPQLGGPTGTKLRREAQEKADLGTRMKLQPHFVSSWFEASFKRVGGRVRRRADGLVEIPVVPDDVVAIARKGDGASVANRYDVATFDPERARATNFAGAQVLGPGALGRELRHSPNGEGTEQALAALREAAGDRFDDL